MAQGRCSGGGDQVTLYIVLAIIVLAGAIDIYLAEKEGRTDAGR